MKKILYGLLAAASVFFAVSCDDGGDSDGSGTGSNATQNADGTTTLTIQEGGKGFVSSTGEVKTEYMGWTGTGYLDGLKNGGNVVYTVSAEETITNAKIALQYCCTEASRMEGAYITVNGTLLNDGSPIAMPQTFKGNKTDSSAETVAKRWVTSAYLENVPLNAGSNTIIITGAPAGTYTAVGGTSITISDGNSGCLNYIDYLIVIGKGIDYGTDTTQYFTLSYASENKTAGSVEGTTTGGSVAEGTSVTLTPKANTGWKFECWSNGSTANPYTFTLKENTILFAHFIPENYTAPSGLVGYATLTADSATAKYTITGGAGATAANTVTISTYDDLKSNSTLLASDEPKIITISGTISTASNANPLLSEKYTVGSNTTIYGDTANQGRLKNIEFIVDGENVIIRNMMFGEVISWDGYTKSGADDALSLNGATHVWVDHCEFQSHLSPQDLDGNAITSSSPYYSSDEDWAKDFYDGLLDIKNGSTWITISNCYFHDHWKACLCASGDGGPDKNTTTGATDSDMRITFYGNYWKNINARQPLFRYGKFHVYDSYFNAGTQNGSASCINVRAGAEAYIEGNTFIGIKSDSYTVGFYYADPKTTYGNISGTWTTTNNTGKTSESTSSYQPPYSYTSSKASTEPTPGTNVGVGVLTASDLN